MSSTRLLMLGAVRIFQPVHGYFVRRELLSWRADQWAKLNPGSIYNALRTLEREGFLSAESSDEKPAKMVYSLTADGKTEFFTLLREALWRVVPNDKSQLFAAIGFLDALSREEVIEALESRLAQLDALHREAPYTLSTLAGHGEHARHIAEYAYLSDAFVMGEREWTAACLERIREGAYAFQGEAGCLTDRLSQG